jgi:hypothetical protein
MSSIDPLSPRFTYELPDELVLNILSFLPPPMLAKMALVCKQWSELSRDKGVWKAICASRGWKKADEKQSWHEFAKVQATRGPYSLSNYFKNRETFFSRDEVEFSLHGTYLHLQMEF